MKQLARRDLLKLGSLAAVGVSPFGAIGCGCPKCPPPITCGEWRNAIGSLSIKPGHLFVPTSARDVIDIVKVAEGQKKRVRMTGSGHSFSDVALSDDFMFLPTQLAQPIPLRLDPDRLKPEAVKDLMLVRVPSGATIGAINTVLDSKNLALANMGGYDGQTIAGVAMTATHGSGIEYGPIASQVVSVQVVASGGAMFQVEPSNGISRHGAFPNGLGTLDEDPQIPIHLVQNDDWFRALVVSMGCMGIVTSMVIRTVPKFWLRESRQLSSWGEISKKGGYVDRLIHGQPVRDGEQNAEHIEIYVNPYPTKKDDVVDHTCVITERRRLSTQPDAASCNQKRGRFGEGQFFADPEIQRRAEAELVKLLNGTSKDKVHKLINAMLWAVSDPDDYCGVSYRVFNVGDINRFRTLGIEMAFPIERTIEATEELFRIAQAQLAKDRRNSVPVTLRFSAKSEFFLAMQQGRTTMMMEIGALLHTRESRDLLTAYEEGFMEKFPDARPHWGLDLSILKGEEAVRKRYPEWPKWKAVYAELNKSGVFKGRMTDRLGI